MRNRHYGETKAQRQADWLAKFTDHLLTLYPHLAGRIDWDAARHYYFGNSSVVDAVTQYAVARNLVEKKNA